ncbi:hypothetical protein DKX38_017732 [Salix brachista]|uniref:Xylanase inhibitor C-terminal domain-containing protein n=1 Tax=Salix brachista TaxID=2182728 RepID=A0A5N5KXE5_9ROSI|nr:hypothetical protein DKX38_017732 [Salix brachista]
MSAFLPEDLIQEILFKLPIKSLVRPSPAYYVNFLGKSVNGVKLNISKTDLAIEKDGGGGCVIDCGALATLLVKPSFDTVHTALADQKTEETHHSQVE